MCSWPAYQLWPCVAVGRGDTIVRVGNQGILTQDNGDVMGYARESTEVHSSTLSCLLSPPLSCNTASLTLNTHCVLLTLVLLVPLPQPLSPYSCRRLVAQPPGGVTTLYTLLRQWLKNTFIQLCQEINIYFLLLTKTALFVSLEYWVIQRSKVSLAC